MKYRIVKIIVLWICLMTACICYSCSRNNGFSEEETLVESAETKGYETEEGRGFLPDTEEITTADKVEETTKALVCYVHICGEVVSPGVYELEGGSRVFEAVKKAGGFTPNAASEYLNLAELVRDGMKIVVPDTDSLETGERYGVAGPGSNLPSGIPGAGPDNIGDLPEVKVNINTADKSRLMTLTGVGEARAEAIIQYREEYGGFERIEDIMKVSGIKDGAFQKIKDNITV